MKLTNDNRGVSEVIGAILVFGLLIALLAILQTQAIPAANEQVEFNHNQDVQSDMMKFKETSSRTISQGTTESTQVRMGTSYPSRLLFFNPPQPGGNIRTAGNGGAKIENLSSPNSDVELYFNKSGRTVSGPETQRLEYEPSYNEYRSAPTVVLEYGGLYRVHGDGSVSVEDYPDVINGNTIDLTYFSGDLSRTTSRSLSLESRPTSAPARTVNVRGHNDNVTLTLPTRLSQEDWNQILDGEPNVHNHTVTDGNVTIELRDRQYQLRMAEVGVGNAVQSPGPEYITRGSTHTLEIEDAQQLPIEVRDKYNNPVSGVEVNVSVSSGSIGENDGSPRQATATTGDQGRPQLVFEPDNPGRVIVNASFQTDQFDDPSEFDPENNTADTQFSIAVQQLLDNNAPRLAELDPENDGWTGECGNDWTFNLLTIDANYGCIISMGFEATDADGNLDTVEVRMVNATDRTVADSVTFDVSSGDGAQMVKDANTDPVGLLDDSMDDNSWSDEVYEYDVRVIVTDSTGLTAEDTVRFVPSDESNDPE